MFGPGQQGYRKSKCVEVAMGCLKAKITLVDAGNFSGQAEAKAGAGLPMSSGLVYASDSFTKQQAFRKVSWLISTHFIFSNTLDRMKEITWGEVRFD
jgi:hypothetical protein